MTPKMHFVVHPVSGCGHCGISASPRGIGWVGWAVGVRAHLRKPLRPRGLNGANMCFAQTSTVTGDGRALLIAKIVIDRVHEFEKTKQILRTGCLAAVHQP